MAAWVLALLCIRLASPNVGLESSSMSTISWGRLVIFHPCNKWAGVSGSGSPISDDTNVREQSFRIALISTTIVFKVWRDTWCLPYTGSYMLLKQSWPLDMCCISLFCGIFPLYTTWNNSGINLGGCSSLILQISFMLASWHCKIIVTQLDCKINVHFWMTLGAKLPNPILEFVCTYTCCILEVA